MLKGLAYGGVASMVADIGALEPPPSSTSKLAASIHLHQHPSHTPLAHATLRARRGCVSLGPALVF